MAPDSSTLAWKIPWTEEHGRLQSMGSRRVGHDWATSLSLFTFIHWRRKWQLPQCCCLENPRDRGAWWAAIYEVAQSLALLKRLSSSSSSSRRWVLSHSTQKSPSDNHQQVAPNRNRDWEEFRIGFCKGTGNSMPFCLSFSLFSFPPSFFLFSFCLPFIILFLLHYSSTFLYWLESIPMFQMILLIIVNFLSCIFH